MTVSRVIVLGSINTDLVMRTPRMPAPGETVLGGSFFQALGGKGANQAVAAARSGESPVLFVGAVGDDEYGKGALAGFAEENLDCRYIKTVPGAASGIAMIVVDRAGENSIAVASGANLELKPADVAGIEDRFFEQAEVLLTSLETPLKTVVAGLKRACEHETITILNPAPCSAEIARPKILQHVDILTPNRVEAEILVGRPLTSRQAFGDAALELIERGCGNVVMTLGGDGALLVTPEETVHIPAMRVAALDTTAAGDAFNGVLACALAEGLPLIDACQRAAAGAAVSVTRRGAQPSLPQRAEIDRMLLGEEIV